MSIAVILGSSFDHAELQGRALTAHDVATTLGVVRLYRWPALAPQAADAAEAFVLFRHGVPHRYLPNQIPYRAHAEALRNVGCRALLVTSSVGVMDANLPLYEPLLVGDLLMPENRLPDGSACTMWPAEAAAQGHLVLGEGLCSAALGRRLDELAGRPLPRAVFAYVGGPRTKTAAENRYLAAAGAQVNSMTLGPELVLANELEIPTAALVVGHKYSLASAPAAAGAPDALRASLVRARQHLERLAAAFLAAAPAPPFANRIYRFGQQ